MTVADIVVVGCSWGGLQSCQRLLRALPADAISPVVIVQHRRDAESELTTLLGRYSPWPVEEPDDNHPIDRRHVYIAPAGYHLLVEPGRFKLSTEGPVHWARPSIDVLFDSAASAYGPRVAGVVLTGANEDGAEGLASIFKAGGMAVVEDPALAMRAEMPEAALAAVPSARVMSVERIGAFIGLLGAAPPGDEDEE